MSMAASLKRFFTSVLPRSSPPMADPESQPAAAVACGKSASDVKFSLQWQEAVMGFCFSSALEISLLFAQTGEESQLPRCFHLLSFLLLLVFLSLFVAKFVSHRFNSAAQVLQRVAILLAATAFIVTVTIPYDLSLRCLAWALYAFCLLLIVTCNSVNL